MTEYHLSDQQLAEIFVADHRVSVQPGDLADDVADDVERYLADNNLTHRAAFRVAVQVERLNKSAPLSAPEINAFEHNMAEGIGDQVPDVSAMSMSEFAAARARLGVAKPSLLEFLGGS